MGSLSARRRGWGPSHHLDMSLNAQPAPSASKGKPQGQPGKCANPHPIDPSAPLRSARHERFAQHVAMGKPDAEAYRLAGFAGLHANKRAAEVRATQGMEDRIAFLRAQADRSITLSKERALQIAAELAEGRHMAEPGHRISAMSMVGKWCGWEKGTEAERKAADALGGVAEMITRIRSRK